MSSNNLSRLKGADKIRKRVGVMLGSDDIRGVKQTLFEIVSNSIDRFKAGHGCIIDITKHSDLSYTVHDKADGLPMTWNEKECAYNWELATRVLYAGGNYDTTNDTHVGQLGVNGLGLASSILSSEFATITSVRNGKKFIVKYSKGRPINKDNNEFLCDDGEDLFTKELGLKVLHSEPCIEHTGTMVHYKPDLDVFTDIDIPIEWMQDKCKKQTVVNKGLIINIKDETTGLNYTYAYEDGIKTYIDELASDKQLCQVIEFSGNGLGKDREDKDDYKVGYEAVITFSNDTNVIECYHNSSELTHGGSPLEGMKSSLTNVINNYIKDKGMYNKSESKIKWIDIEDSIIAVMSSTSSVTSYSNQTKTSIDNKFIQEFIGESIKEQLNIYFIENPIEADKISSQILINKRSREKAAQTRLNVQKKLSNENKSGLSRKIAGLKDCDMRHSTLEERIFLVDEGLSANSTIIEAFDNRYMGCMGLRGRFINSLKASVEDVLNNEPALGIIQALNCGIEIPYEERKKFKDVQTFDIDQLRYGCVGILCDADSFGKGISLSIITFFKKFMPTLLRQGRIYVVTSPRYEVRNKKKESVYAYDEKEKNQIIHNMGSSFLDVSIRKGLGEFNKEEFWDYVLSPKARESTFTRIIYDGDDNEIEYKFNTLMGEDITGRKDFIRNNITNIKLDEID